MEPDDAPYILVIEDEPATAELFAEILRLGGYRVRKAHGSAAAITLINTNRPLAVLLDIMMPDVSGLEVLRYIRRDPALENVPVIVVSGKSAPEEIQSSLDAGAFVHLVKPIGAQELKNTFDRAIR